MSGMGRLLVLLLKVCTVVDVAYAGGAFKNTGNKRHIRVRDDTVVVRSSTIQQ
jgi:hypothetical protein